MPRVFRDDASGAGSSDSAATFIVKFRSQLDASADGRVERRSGRSWRAFVENIETGERRYCETFNCIEAMFEAHGFDRAARAAASCGRRRNGVVARAAAWLRRLGR